MKTTQITFNKVTEGIFRGRDRVVFQFTNTDKTHKLSLQKISLRECSKDDVIMHDIVSDKICTVKLLKFHLETNFPPNWTGYIFLREAGKEIMAERKKLGLSYWANTEISKTTGLLLGKVGKGYLTEIMRNLANYCGFLNPDQFSGRSCRKTGITKMAAHGVPTGEMCASARHQSVKINNVYQTRTHHTAASRQAVFHSKSAPISNAMNSLSIPAPIHHNNHYGDYGHYTHVHQYYPPPPPPPPPITNLPIYRRIVNPYLKHLPKFEANSNHPGDPKNQIGNLKNDNSFDYGGTDQV